MSLSEIINQDKKQSNSLLDYENIFLGAIVGGVIDSEEILRINQQCFLYEETKRLYGIIHKLHLDCGWADYLSILSKLSQFISSSDAKLYLEKIVSSVPAEFNSSQAIESIELAFIRRSSVELLDQSKRLIEQSPYSASEIIFSVYERLNNLIESKVEFNLKTEFDETAKEIIGGLQEKVLIKTGISAIDGLTGGLSTQEVTIFAGRPGHGKTTFSVILTLEILKNNPDKKVLKFELEMSKRAIKHKFLSSLANVSGYKIRTNNLTEEEKIKVLEAAERIKLFENRLFIYDNIYDLSTMNKIARSIKADVVIVDFITLMDGVAQDKRNELGNIMKYAKRFAKSHNSCYIFLSQLNRGAESRESHRPQMSDLAESDQLTQLASDIILLFFKYKYSFDEADKNKLYLIFDKARYAAIGDRLVHFNPDMVQLKEWNK